MKKYTLAINNLHNSNDDLFNNFDKLNDAKRFAKEYASTLKKQFKEEGYTFSLLPKVYDIMIYSNQSQSLLYWYNFKSNTFTRQREAKF